MCRCFHFQMSHLRHGQHMTFWMPTPLALHGGAARFTTRFTTQELLSFSNACCPQAAFNNAEPKCLFTDMLHLLQTKCCVCSSVAAVGISGCRRKSVLQWKGQADKLRSSQNQRRWRLRCQVNPVVWTADAQLPKPWIPPHVTNICCGMNQPMLFSHPHSQAMSILNDFPKMTSFGS